MKKTEMHVTVRRTVNLFYLYTPEQITYLIDEYTIPVLAHDLGIFKRDSKQAKNFSTFTTQLQFLVDAVYLMVTEGKGGYKEKLREILPNGLTKKQIKAPIL